MCLAVAGCANFYSTAILEASTKYFVPFRADVSMSLKKYQQTSQTREESYQLICHIVAFQLFRFYNFHMIDLIRKHLVSNSSACSTMMHPHESWSFLVSIRLEIRSQFLQEHGCLTYNLGFYFLRGDARLPFPLRLEFNRTCVQLYR